jgi:NADP-dependent 3-hydroxy acid dehydrogenase YdfG
MEGLSVDHITRNFTEDDSIIDAVKLVTDKYGHIDVLDNKAGS